MGREIRSKTLSDGRKVTVSEEGDQYRVYLWDKNGTMIDFTICKTSAQAAILYDAWST